MLVYQRVPYECVIGITVCLYMSILFWGKKKWDYHYLEDPPANSQNGEPNPGIAVPEQTWR